ncbi:MAG: SRPBCC domain-containing protein [Bacteroidetes bacterium]|nr:SRPBCC domain-containing protein [Bacteroidota bacterium]
MNQNTDFTCAFLAPQSPSELFKILLDVRNWWSGKYAETIEGASSRLGDEFSFSAGGGAHFTRQRLVELVPNEKIVWLVIESKLTFIEEQAEWEGTRFGFDLSREGDQTKITFTHTGLVPEIACYESCSTGWMAYLSTLEKRLMAS